MAEYEVENINKLGHDTPVKKRRVKTEKNDFSENDKRKVESLSSPKQKDESSKLIDYKSDDKAVEEQTILMLDTQNYTEDSGNCSSSFEKSQGSASPTYSEASESDWQPSVTPSGLIEWIQMQVVNDKDPKEIVYKLFPHITNIPEHVDNWTVWKLLVRMLSEPPRRTKLTQVNTFDDVIRLIKSSSKILVLTGAGVSVSCGIPDFRSRDGVYARLAVDFPDLPNPEAMFDITYFKHDPRPFFKFAKEIYPGQYKPSRVHRFINLLEKTDRLLRNYTQNIDTLEQVAGITKVIQCHGSFATASCQVCKHQVGCDDIRDNIFNQVVPRCPKCSSDENGILKPDIVFFGENLPEHFHRQMTADKDDADLLIVIGSALKVRPVALIPNSLPGEIPQILINRETLSHLSFDVELLGDGDTIITEICKKLGEDFTELGKESESLNEIDKLPECSEADSSINDNQDVLLPNGSSYENEPELDVSSSENKISSLSNSTQESELSSCNKVAAQSANTVREMSVETRKSEKCPTPDTTNETIPDDSESNLATISGNEMDSELKKFDSSISNNEQTLSGLWKSRWKQSISKRLPLGAYYYDGEHRYIFPGAEVPPEEDSDCSSDDDSSSNSSDDQETLDSTLNENHTALLLLSDNGDDLPQFMNRDTKLSSSPCTINQNGADSIAAPTQNDSDSDSQMSST
ncbi:NAD-dependent protein deacetylase sirtuin-1-like [Clavelina lepadiformis]|uniref:NAD-dependent protein deacetylase sirtuin-1-like n=1 Tax=Clavelina lepadiformis TaxID=159417 RepID=UPI004043291F